jgi:hypothetical protein
MCSLEKGSRSSTEPAAAGDDDDVDGGIGVELRQRLTDLGDGVRALHRHLPDLEAHWGQRGPAFHDDVVTRPSTRDRR